jgi:N-acetyltransferase 10
MRKKVDQKIRTLIENVAKTRQRGLFVIVGDKGREQVRLEVSKYIDFF